MIEPITSLHMTCDGMGCGKEVTIADVSKIAYPLDWFRVEKQQRLGEVQFLMTFAVLYA